MDRLILREDYGPDDQPTVAGRTLTIRIATIGRMYRVAEAGRKVLRERIETADAFREPLARPRGVLRFRHKGEHDDETDDLDNFHGVMTGMVLRDKSVFTDFRVFEGAREDRLLDLVQHGGLKGASMSAIIAEAKPARDGRGPFTSIRRIREVNGVSLTPKPAYDDAEVVAVRELEQADPEAARARLQAAEAARRDNEAARARLQALQSR